VCLLIYKAWHPHLVTHGSDVQGLTKTGEDYAVKAAHVELAERMRKVPTDILC
jgi:hypothetical protein